MQDASGVSGNLHEWIIDYLHNREQYITVNGESSDSMEVKYGVLHGSLLGQRLCGIHANDFPGLSDDSTAEMFADDSKAY